MALKVPDVSLILLLQSDIDHDLDGAHLHLFKNNLIPAFNTQLTDFTEADFSGYAVATLSSWGPAANAGPRASADHAPVDFTHDGGIVGNTIYGYYITNDTDDELILLERDPFAPISMVALADNYRVIPQFTRRSEF